jgi:hypothetical protein
MKHPGITIVLCVLAFGAAVVGFGSFKSWERQLQLSYVPQSMGVFAEPDRVLSATAESVASRRLCSRRSIGARELTASFASGVTQAVSSRSFARLLPLVGNALS